MSPRFSPDLALYFCKCLCTSFAAAAIVVAADAAAAAAAVVFKENGLLNLFSKASSPYNKKCDRNVDSDSFQAPEMTINHACSVMSQRSVVECEAKAVSSHPVRPSLSVCHNFTHSVHLPKLFSISQSRT